MNSTYTKRNYPQGTESFHNQTGLHITYTLRRPDRKNLRHPVSSYNYGG